MKTAIVVLSDPKNGTEESAGHAFNALALSAVYDLKSHGEEVTVLFQVTGTRWVGELTKTDHPFRKLFEAVKGKVAGLSCGCAEAFGASESAQQACFDS